MKSLISWITIPSIFLCVSQAMAAGVFMEKDGVVVIDVEAEPAKGSWAVEKSLDGFLGESYYRAKSNGNAGADALNYEIIITNPGKYQLVVRNRIASGSSSTENNDSFLKMSGKPVAGGYSIKTNGWEKFYVNAKGLNKWTWETSTKDFDAQAFRQEFTAGKHTVGISRRSANHAVDRLALFKYEDHAWSAATGKATADTELDALPLSLKEGEVVSLSRNPHSIGLSATGTTALFHGKNAIFVGNEKALFYLNGRQEGWKSIPGSK